MDDGLLPVDYRVKYRLHCPTMLGFLDHWKDHYSPPQEFIDYLMDHDLDAAAECVRWVDGLPKRRRHATNRKAGHYYPYRYKFAPRYYVWRVDTAVDYSRDSHTAPWMDRDGVYSAIVQFENFPNAICWLFEQFEKHRPDH